MTTLAIRAARAFDGERMVERPLILVEKGSITGVTSGGSAAPAGTEIIDLGDATLIPGLIDTHVHLAFDSSADPVSFACDSSDETLFEAMRRNAKASLDAGVTTIRDLGDRSFLALRLREELAGAPASGPDILTSGPPLTAQDGHLHYFGGVIDDAASARTVVRRWHERGVDVIKVVGSGGELTPGTDPFGKAMPDATLRAIVAEAHERGLQVTVHAHSPDAIEQAVETGADGVEHGMFLAPDGIRAEPRIIDRLVERRVAHCPTLVMVPGGVPGPPRIRKRLGAMLALVGDLYASGVCLVGGSDAGIADVKPHGVMPNAVRQFVEVGIPADEALRIVTSQTADALGLAQKGRLAGGKDADIVAVRGDPLADPHVLTKIEAVFHRGVRIMEGVRT